MEFNLSKDRRLILLALLFFALLLFLSLNDKVVSNFDQGAAALSAVKGAQAFTALPKLNANQIKELQALYLAKLNAEKSFNKLKEKKQSILSAQATLNRALTNLKNAEAKYKVPAELRQQLDEANVKNPGWIANYNSAMFKSDEEKKKLTGLVKPANFSSTATKAPAKSNFSGTLPDFFDWRNAHGRNYITPIRDQQFCGSCWAFAAASTLEGQINAYYNRNLNVDLSEQDLISCNGGGTCSGGWPETSFQRIRDDGITTETCFLYTATDDSCSNRCLNWQDSAWKISGYYNLTGTALTTENIKQALVSMGPVTIGYEVYQDFFSYSGGIYQHIWGGFAGYHAVTVVGYGKQDGADYFIVKNSWGPAWGENGYFRIYAGNSGMYNMFALSVEQPIPPTSQTKICGDKDGDKYCNWGLGPKPVTGCPKSCNAEADCDDSNASIYKGCGKSTEKTGILNIISTPSEANVYVKDTASGEWVFRGETPIVFNLNVSTRDIKLTKEDYFDYFGEADIIEGRTTNLNVVLNAAPKLIFPLNNDIFRAGDVLKIRGTTGEVRFESFDVQWQLNGEGAWSSQGITLINGGTQPITEGTLAAWDTSFVKSPGFYKLKLTSWVYGDVYTILVQNIYLDPTLKIGWPQRINFLQAGEEVGSVDQPKTHLSQQKSTLKAGIKQRVDLLKNISSADINLIKNINIDSASYFLPGDLATAVADIDKDGRKEIVVYTNGSPAELTVYKDSGNVLWRKQILNGSGSIANIPSIGDVDNDGNDEIVICGQNDAYVFKKDGSILWQTNLNIYGHAYISTMIADLDNDGGKEIVLKLNWGSGIIILDKYGRVVSRWDAPLKNTMGTNLYPSLAVGNFDDDADLEIVYSATRGGYLQDGSWFNDAAVYVLNMDGSIIDGWPVNLPGSITSSPVVGDINNDGKQEIVIGLIYLSDVRPNISLGGLYAFNRGGSMLPGWPVKKGEEFWSTPSLGDINGDGKPEISASEIGGKTFIFRNDGSVVSGWPRSTSWSDWKGSLMADVNKDNKIDVLTTAGNGFYPIKGDGGVYGWNNNGTIIPGFPKLTEVDAHASAVIDDIDNDGKIEIVASSNFDFDFLNSREKYRGSVYVWEIDAPYNKDKMPWPMFMHDNQRTGCYDCDKTNVTRMITVTSPNGGETWRSGSKQTMRWESTNVPADHLILSIRLKNLATKEEISLLRNVLNDGSEEIIVPENLKGTYQLEIKSLVSGTSVFDTSDNSFSIIPRITPPLPPTPPPPPPPTITCQKCVDMNGDRLITPTDVIYVINRQDQCAGAAKFEAKADITNDNCIKKDDALCVQEKLGQQIDCQVTPSSAAILTDNFSASVFSFFSKLFGIR